MKKIIIRVHRISVPLQVLRAFLQATEDKELQLEFVKVESEFVLALDILYKKHERHFVLDVIELVDEFIMIREEEEKLKNLNSEPHEND